MPRVAIVPSALDAGFMPEDFAQNRDLFFELCAQNLSAACKLHAARYFVTKNWRTLSPA